MLFLWQRLRSIPCCVQWDRKKTSHIARLTGVQGSPHYASCDAEIIVSLAFKPKRRYPGQKDKKTEASS